MDANPSAPKEQYDAKRKELEAIANPIMQKLYGAAGGDEGGMPGMPGGFPGAGGSSGGGKGDDAGPKIEEVD